MTRLCPLCSGEGRVPTEIETRAWVEWRWRFTKTGLVQTALVADAPIDEYERITREVGLWRGPWGLA